MTNNAATEKIYKHLKMFMNQSNWLDNNVPEQARAMFTTLCLMDGIDADTSASDNILLRLYIDSDIASVDISYDDFKEFMIELIV